MLHPISSVSHSRLPSYGTITTGSSSQIASELGGAVEEESGEEQTSALAELEIVPLMDSPAQVEPITYLEAIHKLIKPSVSLSLSSLGMALQGIVNGIVVRHLSQEEMAAIPLAMASIAELFAPVQGILTPTGVFVAELSGAQENAKIGETVIQSGWLVLGLSLPAGMLLQNLSSFLSAAGISEEVSHAAQKYCSAFNYGIVPSLLHTNDLLFAQGNKQPQIILVTNTARIVLSMLLSYALTVGAFGLPRLGISGLGYATALSAWSGFIGLRLYYKFNQSYDKFELFNLHLPNAEAILKLLKIGLPIGLSNAILATNAVIFSLLVGKLDKNVSVAQEVSSIPVSAFKTLLTGWVVATGVEVANTMGELKIALERNESALVIERLQQNVRSFGNVGIIIGLSAALSACLLFTGLSKPISEIFLDTSRDIPKETLQLAQTLLSINGVGLLIDTLKDISESNLLSLQDTVFSSLLNVSGMLIGLSASVYLSLQANEKAEWLFISQLLGSLIAAVGISHRWLKKSSFNENYNMNLHRLA